MACSAAQLLANQNNAKLSTGPRSAEGKERARRNGLKHGLTGAGVVLHPEDAQELARRYEMIHAEMAPKTEVAARLVAKVALATVKLDRCAEHEAKAVSYRVRHAVEAFDDERLAEVEKAFSWLAAEPATHARRLRNSPEGIARVLESLGELRRDLTRPEGPRWTFDHCHHFHHLIGKRRTDTPFPRARCLFEAICGRFEFLEPADAPDLPHADRQHWAIDTMVGLIDAEVAQLEGHLAGFDRAMIELDRAEAPARALFDPSKEAVLARKYEAAIERGLYRALREIREVEAGSTEVVAEEELDQVPDPEMGSSLPEPPPPPVEADRAADDDLPFDPAVERARKRARNAARKRVTSANRGRSKD